MLESKYGTFAETAKERRLQFRAYSAETVSNFLFCVCDMDDITNKKGKAGAEYRRSMVENASTETLEKWEKVGGIGTAYFIISVPTSALGYLRQDDYNKLFDKQFRIKATNGFYAVINKLLQKGIAKVIARGSDYISDFFEEWEKEKYNFGYAFERAIFGESNRGKSRADGTFKAHLCQAKCSFTLYRLHEAENTSSANGTPYAIGTQKGISTSNGIN